MRAAAGAVGTKLKKSTTAALDGTDDELERKVSRSVEIDRAALVSLLVGGSVRARTTTTTSNAGRTECARGVFFLKAWRAWHGLVGRDRSEWPPRRLARTTKAQPPLKKPEPSRASSSSLQGNQQLSPHHPTHTLVSYIIYGVFVLF